MVIQQSKPATRPVPEAIEVFKTNIENAAVGAAVVRALHRYWPALRVSLDLDDCDRVLRVVAPPHLPAPWPRVVALVRSLGVAIEVLPD